ncbi:unnamed protein product [Somion occarium]|uniref:Uncharacterized protein n=1 Tax=Somion occarium TaxID=3059160 RepID=A0ABP1D6Z5_9APHY
MQSTSTTYSYVTFVRAIPYFHNAQNFGFVRTAPFLCVPGSFASFATSSRVTSLATPCVPVVPPFSPNREHHLLSFKLQGDGHLMHGKPTSASTPSSSMFSSSPIGSLRDHPLREPRQRALLFIIVISISKIFHTSSILHTIRP